MARYIKSERQGRFVFYGAMIAEDVIALIWAAAGYAIYTATGGLSTGLQETLALGQSAAIYDVCVKTMGGVGIALVMVVLWSASMLLFMEKKNYWLAAVPATFMTAVSITYFVAAGECLNLGTTIAYPVGIIAAVAFLVIFLRTTKKVPKPDCSSLIGFGLLPAAEYFLCGSFCLIELFDERAGEFRD